MHSSEKTFRETVSLDLLRSEDALSLMLASHVAALGTIQPALTQIGAAAQAVADALSLGATLHYAAAGSSGLMALADACELPGTFGVPQDQLRVSMAGGVPVDGLMAGNTEDSVDEALEAAKAVRPGDVAIVVSASGTTPFAIAFAGQAKSRGARVIAIANVERSALLDLAEVAITLNTAPEVVEGSTRLGAGTAQKAVLNMISTQVGVLLGHVHEGMMVNLNPDNAKLRKRAAVIVSKISGVGQIEAEQALRAADLDTKLAVLVASGVEVEAARTLLQTNMGRLRTCLQEIGQRTEKIT